MYEESYFTFFIILHRFVSNHILSYCFILYRIYNVSYFILSYLILSYHLLTFLPFSVTHSFCMQNLFHHLFILDSFCIWTVIAPSLKKLFFKTLWRTKCKEGDSKLFLIDIQSVSMFMMTYHCWDKEPLQQWDCNSYLNQQSVDRWTFCCLQHHTILRLYFLSLPCKENLIVFDKWR